MATTQQAHLCDPCRRSSSDYRLGVLPTNDVKSCNASTCEARDGTLIVENLASGGSMTKGEFLATLRREVHAAAEQELVGTGWTAEQCPWIEYWFAYYERRSAFDIEAALRKFAPDTRLVSDATGYIEPVAARVRAAVARWRKTGEVGGPSDEIMIPASVEAQASLGPGTPLESSVRSRMEGATGTSLADVRVHADELGHRAAAREGAAAVAVGSHIAFAHGEYQPETAIGELLLAHELAHTLQQRGATSAGAGSEPSYEADANRAALGIAGHLSGGSAFAPRPQKRSGLQLQRCKEQGLKPAAEGPIPDYDSFSDATGTIYLTGPKADALGAMFQNPDQLDRVFADAASGNARAKKIVEELHTFFEGVGTEIARIEGKPDCLIPAWRELKTVVTTGCEVNWSGLSYLKADRPAGAALREDVARGYSRKAREVGVRNTIIINSLNLLMVGWQLKASLAGEARALGVRPGGKPLETRPPVDTKPPIETRPPIEKPVETKPVETKPVETKPVETKPVETMPVETKPVEKPPFPADEFADEAWKQWPPSEPAKTKPRWDEPGGARWRYDRYRYDKWLEGGGGKTPPQDLMSPKEYFDRYVAPKAIGQSPGELGSPQHAELVKKVRADNGIKTETMGRQRPDAVGRVDQPIKVGDRVFTPKAGGRVLYEAENFFSDGSQMVSEGRAQVRQFRADNPDATIVCQDVANPKNIVVYEPGTQPPPPGRLKPNTPNTETIPPKP